MGTSGFWGMTHKEIDKKVLVWHDAYPENLGKEVVSLIHNNLEDLGTIFNHIMLVKDMDNDHANGPGHILNTPDDVITTEKLEAKYFIDLAEQTFDTCDLEYGYMINLDSNELQLYKGDRLIAKIGLKNIKYKNLAAAFKKDDANNDE